MEPIADREEEKEYLLAEYENEGVTLFMDMPRDPVDTVWYNLGRTHGYHFLRRYCWNILGVFLIIFVSTPAVIFQTLKSISEDNFDLSIFNYIPFVESYSKYIPTLIILLINLLLLIMIDQSALAEKHSSHSKYQSSVFSKAVVYLHLNMVLFPYLGLQETPIFKLLKLEPYNKEYIKDFSMIDSSPFFVNLIVQYAVFGVLFYLLRLGEIILFSFSPWLTDYVRTKFNTTQSWRRRPDYTFQYGYFYSQLVTVFTIIILFSSTSPMVVIAGAFYYWMRNIVDAHLLMSVHRKEMDSGVRMFQRIISLILFSLILYQLFIALYFYLNSMIIQCYIVSFVV